MKSWPPTAISISVLMLGWAVAAWPAPPTPLTTLRAIRTLTNAQAEEKLPAAFEATVTYYRKHDHFIFMQDGESGTYVQTPADLSLIAGDRVLVQGTTRGSFRPFVVASDITVLRRGAVVPSITATFDELIRAQYDCRMVIVRGVVRSVDRELAQSSTANSTTLQILTDGGYIEASIDNDDEEVFKSLLDAEVDVTGVSAGKFDGKMQQTGVRLYVSRPKDIKILNRGGDGPLSLPITPMDRILTGYHIRDLTRRVKVRGAITYFQPGTAVVLQNSESSLWIMTRTLDPLRVGDVAEATGFPDVHDDFLTLTRSEITDTHVQSPVAPRPLTWWQMTSRGHDIHDHVFDLVSIEGIVAAEERETVQDVYVLVSDGHTFSAVYRHPSQASQIQLAPMKMIPLGSRVRVAGICIAEGSSPNQNHAPFDILLNSLSDITVVATPSWLTIRNLSYVISGLLLVVIASGAWGWSLTRKVHLQTRALAARVEAEAALERRMTQLEQRRSRILEAINGSQPLANILAQVTELVTFLLDGAPCWCEIHGEICSGNDPQQTSGLRIVRLQIAAGSGPVLGSLIAGLSLLTPPSAMEAEALSTGARLATLAVENRRLYANLVHRSEHDLLTDIPNRFSLEQQLDRFMGGASRNEATFGLIYIDLDKFKQINDRFGHRTGDLYLQAVAGRMKCQLRSGDVLARIGGDEFIALVPILRGRGDAEEVAERLERCFDEPFELEGLRLQGAASVGLAVFPEDGANKEELQRSADAAMYSHKEGKRRLESLTEGLHH